MSTTTEPTLATHPFKVGRMVYETLDDALDKARTAAKVSGATVHVQERLTGTFLYTITERPEIVKAFNAGAARATSRCPGRPRVESAHLPTAAEREAFVEGWMWAR